MRYLFYLSIFVIVGCGPTRTQIKERQIAHKPPPDQEQRFSNEGMTLEGEMGTLDQADVRNVMDANMAGFNNCFAKSAGSFVAGDVLLKFIVDEQGRVDTVSVEESSLGSHAIEDCLVQTSRFLEFPPPMGNGKAKFAYPLSWNNAGRRLSMPVDATWGYEALRGHHDTIERCRQTHSFPHPFYLTVYVGRRGQVLSAGFHSSQPPKGEFPTCVVQSLQDMRFPDPGPRIAKYKALVENLNR